ncbi:TPA: hypothetical protein ACHKXG_000972 [Escherichia coli]|nr:hypothetical protein BvCmsK139A_04657 [Escherichia coli]
MTIKSIVINGKTILSTPNAINEGVWFDMLEVHQAAGLPYVGGPYSLAGGGSLRCV